MATQNKETLMVGSDVSVNTNENTFKFGGSVTEFTGKIKKGLAAQEAALNEVKELLKSKNISKEEHDSLWREAYEKAVDLLDYKVKMGKLIAETESASGQRSDLAPVGSKVSKKAVSKALGLTKKQSDDYQKLARNPGAVEKAKIEAMEKKDIPTVYLVLQFIKQTKEVQKPSDEPATGDSANPITASETTDYKLLKCLDLPTDCDIQEFVNTTMNVLKPTEEKSIYVYFQVVPDEIKSNIEILIETLMATKIGVCVDN